MSSAECATFSALLAIRGGDGWHQPKGGTALFEIDFLTEYTDEALLAELRRIAAFLLPGRVLTKATYEQHSPKVAYSTIRRRFGGWREALERAGLGDLYHGQFVSRKMRDQPARGWSNDDFLRELKRVFSVVGKECLTRDDFNKHSDTSDEALRRRFGSFRAALNIAGIPAAPVKSRRFSEIQCFENLANVWTYYGRPPEYREMFAVPSLIQGKTYILRWGTWRKAMGAFVDWSETNDQSTSSEAAIGTIIAAPVQEQINRTEADSRDIRPGLRFRVFLRDRFRCVACGRSPATNLGVELHADHKLAVAHGGRTTLENLQTLCRDCNLGKGRLLVASQS